MFLEASKAAGHPANSYEIQFIKLRQSLARKMSLSNLFYVADNFATRSTVNLIMSLLYVNLDREDTPDTLQMLIDEGESRGLH